MKIKQKINLILSSTLSISVIGSLATILVEQQNDFLSKKNEVTSDGFTLVNVKDESGVYKTIDPISRYTFLPSQLSQPLNLALGETGGTNIGKSSNNSKTLYLNDKFFINFYKTKYSGNGGTAIDPNEPPSIITSSTTGPEIENKTLFPIGTTEIISAIHPPSSEKLFVIAKGNYVEEGLDVPAGTLSPGSPTGNHLILQYKWKNPTNQNAPKFDVEVAKIFNISGPSPVIAPTHIQRQADNAIQSSSQTFYMYQQNQLATSITLNGFSDINTIAGWESTPITIDFGKPSKVFAVNPIQIGSTEETNFIIYHSIEGNTGLQISIFNKLGTRISNLILDQNITSSAIDINNLMTSAKIVDNKGEESINWELFYALTETDKNKIFSTKINPDFLFLHEQPSAIDLGAHKKNISLISYDSINNNSADLFEEGNTYIPVQYQDIGGIGNASHSNGLINWKETSNNQYWSQSNFSSGDASNNISKSFSLVEKIGDPAGLTLSKSAIITNIDFDNNKVQYTFSDGEFINNRSTINYSQTRDLADLTLNYETETPAQIVTKISAKNPSYVNLDPNEINNRLLDQIEGGTTNIVFSGTPSPQDGIKLDDKKTEPVTGAIATEYNYINGSYENGQYIPTGTTPKSLPVVFIQEPENSLFTLEINFNLADSKKLPTTIVSEIKDAIGSETGELPNDWQSNPEITKWIGFDSSSPIQISYEYLPFLNRIIFAPDDMMGTIKIEFAFNEPGAPRLFNVELNSSGFAAYVYLIAIIVPTAIIILAIVLLTTFLILSKKKKVELSNSLQAGFALSKKMSTINPSFKNRIVASKNENTRNSIESKPINQVNQVSRTQNPSNRTNNIGAPPSGILKSPQTKAITPTMNRPLNKGTLPPMAKK